MEKKTVGAQFHGDGATLLGMYVVHVLLTLLTLGVYGFWARAKQRQYMYSQTSFAGDRFAYHGTGQELLIGWLKAVAIMAPLLGLHLFFRFKVEPPAGIVLAMVVFYVAAIGITPLIILGSWRFRLHRTSWRGIRFSFRGKAGEFWKLFVRGALITLVTFGIYGFWLRVQVRRYLLRHTYFGDATFDFEASAGELLWKTFIAVLLALPTLGLSFVWLSAWSHRYFAGGTSFRGESFRSSVKTLDLFLLQLTNGLIVLGTLGIGFPWAMVRARRFFLERITLESALDFDAIAQQAQQGSSALGEGMGELLDLGVFDLDLGL